MNRAPFKVCNDPDPDTAEIDRLLDEAFSLGRRTKTSYRLREGEKAVRDLSFSARDGSGRLTGTISFWPLCIGDAGHACLLLGPLAVAPDVQGSGLGLALMDAGLTAARAQGHHRVILVGDAPYYERAGFRQVPHGRLVLPGPVDYNRLMWLALSADAFDRVAGLVLGQRRFNGLRDTT